MEYYTFVNNYHYLRQDADFLLQLAEREPFKEGFEKTKLSRTALLLYLLAFEALIKRAWDAYLPLSVKDFFMEREEKFDLGDKWEMLPMLINAGSKNGFDQSSYPWSHFKELVKMRNDFVHPSHRRFGLYDLDANTKTMTHVEWNRIPKDICYKDEPEKPTTDKNKWKEFKETDIVYRQTLIRKDPYTISREDVLKVRKILDDMICGLDALLDGRLTKEGWLLKSDKFHRCGPYEE